MPDTYDHITLMCRLKAAQRRNKELESGERYIQLEELHQKEYNVYEHKIEKLKKELADAYKETIRVRNYWFQVLEDMLREFEKAQKRSAQELRKMEIRALNAEKQRDDALDKAAVFRHQFYEAASRLEEEQGNHNDRGGDHSADQFRNPVRRRCLQQSAVCHNGIGQIGKVFLAKEGKRNLPQLFRKGSSPHAALHIGGKERGTILKNRCQNDQKQDDHDCRNEKRQLFSWHFSIQQIGRQKVQ